MLTIIPCAGRGTRLKGIGLKELHEVGGRPMIAYALDTALAYGSRDVLLVISPGKEDVPRYVQTRGAFRVMTVYQYEPLGTGHALSLLSGLLSRGRVLYLMPDVIIRPELDQILGSLNERALVYLWETAAPKEKGCFLLDSRDDMVINHVEKQVPPWPPEPRAPGPAGADRYLAWGAAVLAPSFIDLCAEGWRSGAWKKWALRNRGGDDEFTIDDAFDLCLEKNYRITGIKAGGWNQDCGTYAGIERAECLLSGFAS